MIKVTDVAYARFRAPDLTTMETFLTDFGLECSTRAEEALYMRACGPDHHVHITEVGDPAFIGMAFHAASEEDLRKLSQSPVASDVQERDEPQSEASAQPRRTTARSRSGACRTRTPRDPASSPLPPCVLHKLAGAYPDIDRVLGAHRRWLPSVHAARVASARLLLEIVVEGESRMRTRRHAHAQLEETRCTALILRR